MMIETAPPPPPPLLLLLWGRWALIDKVTRPKA